MVAQPKTNKAGPGGDAGPNVESARTGAMPPGYSTGNLNEWNEI